MEMVTEYLFQRYLPKRDPVPFPQYLMPIQKWKNDFWITKEGECVCPREMTDQHLVHTVLLIHRQIPSLPSRYDNCSAEQFIEYGLYEFHIHLQRMKSVERYNRHRGRKRNKSYFVPIEMERYYALWNDYHLYMLLRREINVRGLEDHL